jgi:hypothetical protein
MCAAHIIDLSASNVDASGGDVRALPGDFIAGPADPKPDSASTGFVRAIALDTVTLDQL